MSHRLLQMGARLAKASKPQLTTAACYTPRVAGGRVQLTERRAIVESEALLALGQMKLGLERVELLPESEHIFLGLRKTDAHIDGSIAYGQQQRCAS